MEIYIIIHKWDNGESFEDKCFYEDRKHFSTKEKATQYYNSKITAKYIGSYSIVKVPLDNPSEEDETICKTEYKYCPPAYILADQEAKEEADRMAAEEEFDMWVAQQLAEME